jgi:hypothetical protein
MQLARHAAALLKILAAAAGTGIVATRFALSASYRQKKQRGPQHVIEVARYARFA